MADPWNDLIDELIVICRPDEYLKFLHTGDMDAIKSGMLTDIYRAVPLMVLTHGIYLAVMSLPDADLTPLRAGLDRLWQAVIDDRDTSRLTGDDEAEDSYFVEELELLREEADGLLAIFESYVAAEPGPEADPDPLIQQANVLTASHLPNARRAFGQAGAAILRGAAYWPLWHFEFEQPPMAAWTSVLHSLVTTLKMGGLYPLAPLAAERRQSAEKIGAMKEKIKFAPVSVPGEKADAATLLPEARQLMDILLCGQEQLSAEQLASLPPLTPELLKTLSYITQSSEYAYNDAPGKGYAPIHAARLLGDSGSPEAVEPLLFALYTSDPEDLLWSAALAALGTLGPIALPAILDSMRYSTDPDFKAGAAEVLSQLGRGDERAFRALEAYFHETTWDEDRAMAIKSFNDLGDPRALPILLKSLNDRDIIPLGIDEVVATVRRLDPNYDPAELKRLEAKARQRYDSRLVRFDKYGQAFCRDCGALMRKDDLGEWEHLEPESAPAVPPAHFSPRPDFGLPALDPRFSHVGRNDPCPCGSGKKFKQCHGATKPTVH